MSGIRVGRWDCAVCGHKGNIGYETSCSQCGAPRGKNVKFYLPDESEEVQDERQLAQARAGVDWICDYCGADNKATDTHCRSCGNARTETDINRQTREIRFDARTAYFICTTSATYSSTEVQQRLLCFRCDCAFAYCAISALSPA
jgi:ribosomal protein L40E